MRSHRRVKSVFRQEEVVVDILLRDLPLGPFTSTCRITLSLGHCSRLAQDLQYKAATEVSIRASCLLMFTWDALEEGSFLLSHMYESCECEEGDALVDWSAVA